MNDGKALIDWRSRLAERGFPGARQVPCMHGAAVLRSFGEALAAEAALRELLGRAPEEEGVLRALMKLLHETGRSEECVPLRRRLHLRRCRELGIPEDQWESAIAFLEATETGAAAPRASDAYVAALFDQYSGHFDQKLCGDLSYRAPEHVLEALGETLSGRGGLEVLDLGCGTGLAGVRVRPLARRLTGVDLSAGMLERARERGVYDALYTGELTAWLGAAEARYELVLAVDVLVYFGALEELFTQVARRLAPGGLFAFTAEKGPGPGHQLRPTGRYVHHADYLRESARGVGLAPVVEHERVLRTERGEPVIGHVMVMSSPDSRLL